jgi:hypothetical protein
MFEITFMAALAVGAVYVVALVQRFRRAGAVQRQQIKWFAYGAALSIPLGLFPQAKPWGPYLELLGAALQLGGLGIGIFRFRLWEIDRLINRTLVYGLLTVLLGAVYAGLVLALGSCPAGSAPRRRAERWPGRPWPWPRSSSGGVVVAAPVGRRPAPRGSPGADDDPQPGIVACQGPGGAGA